MKRHILSSVPVEVRFVTNCRGLVKCSVQPFGVKVNLLTVNHRSVCLSVYVPQAACPSVCLFVCLYMCLPACLSVSLGYPALD